MRWLLFSSESNSIGKHCGDLLQVAGQTVLNEHSSPKGTSLQQVKDKITNEKPDRIIVIVDEDRQPTQLIQTITEHLLLPIYVAQATNNSYSPIPVLVISSTSAEPNLAIVQNATDQLMLFYSHLTSVKLFTPIGDEDLNEGHFKSLWQGNADEWHRISILSDVLPILLALAHDGKTSGQVDVCNKGTVSLRWIEQWNQDPTKIAKILPPSIETEDLTDKFERWTKQLIEPETRQIYQASYLVPMATKTLQQVFQQQALEINPNAPKILLVTGGCGFIGSTFINYWLQTYPQDRIINIDRLDPVANTKNISNPDSPNYSLIVADINNKDIVLHLMNQYNITHIVHLAVQAHLDTSFGNSITFTESNVYGTHSVLEASRIYGKIQKFIHISTDEVYGQTPAGSQQEICLLNPLNPYAATIAAAEFLVKSYGESFKLPFCIIRLCNVYGPRQYIEKVIPNFILALSNGEALKIHGDGQQIRHYLYVDDVVRAIELIFIKGKTKMIYNIGTSNALTVLEIAKCLLTKLPSSRPIEEVLTYGKGRSFMEQRYYSTTSGLVKSLGWKEQVTFDQGLEKTIQWFKDNPNYWNKSH